MDSEIILEWLECVDIRCHYVDFIIGESTMKYKPYILYKVWPLCYMISVVCVSLEVKHPCYVRVLTGYMIVL